MSISLQQALKLQGKTPNPSQKLTENSNNCKQNLTQQTLHFPSRKIKEEAIKEAVITIIQTGITKNEISYI